MTQKNDGSTPRAKSSNASRPRPGIARSAAYDQLKAIMGEGSLLNALGGMLRQVRTAESLLAADKDRKSENATAISSFARSTHSSSSAKSEPSPTPASTPSSTLPSRSDSSASSRTQSPISRGTTSASRRAKSSASASSRAAAPTRDRNCRSGMRGRPVRRRNPAPTGENVDEASKIATSLSGSSPP